MFTACGLEVSFVGVNAQPMPSALIPLLTAAVALGAERAETAARLDAYQYLLVASAS